jgi:hypothetical protein
MIPKTPTEKVIKSPRFFSIQLPKRLELKIIPEREAVIIIIAATKAYNVIV